MCYYSLTLGVTPGLLPALSSALPPSCLPLSQQLKEIVTVTVAVVNLEYEGSVLPVEVRQV